MTSYIPGKEELNRELGKLPALSTESVRKKYLGSWEDASYMLEFIARSPNNAATINWLSCMSDLWEQVRLSLAWASTYDTWYGGLPEGMVPGEILEGTLRDEDDLEHLVRRWEEAEAGCVYYLENALYRFYAFNEMLLQFCNSCIGLGVTEDRVRRSVIEQRLEEAGQRGDSSAKRLAAGLAELCRSPAYQHIVEARKGITHRQNPFRERTVQEGFEERAFSCPRMLRVARELFTDITQSLDWLFEFIASRDMTAEPRLSDRTNAHHGELISQRGHVLVKSPLRSAATGPRNASGGS